MGKKRNKAITKLIKKDNNHNTGWYAADKDGCVYWYQTILGLRHDILDNSWNSDHRLKFIGKVNPFNGNGWKSSLWNNNDG